MNTTLPPARDLPPHRHARIRATLVRAASQPPPRRWLAPALTVTTAVVALGLVMWFVPLGDSDGQVAGSATTTAAAPPTTAEEGLRQIQVPAEDVPGLVQGCVDSAGVEDYAALAGEPAGTFELKLAFADAAGQLAVLYSGEMVITCEFGGEYKPGFAVLGEFRPPISADLNQTAPVTGDPEQGYQLVVGRVDPATTARVTLTVADLTTDATLVGDVYAARVIRPTDWWLAGDNPPPATVDAYDAEGNRVGGVTPHP
ncbi:hypothetical protein BLA60_14240 [Actinophytocola xinjiangensis]|uniref:Uncharacterized protein n=1 Tax=Actinophytocola xinjiangensis TaxID=485602 RepID=A0A7Z0WMS7_9PSEU|nr:hypothetical protein [Actinophytocola xinjiangensis]OLF11143.1 hypothetical protein BLA60_14240 [Actinophytocola xinjiangensis]